MDIEIITTGNEIMTGLVVDSNKAWMAERCQLLGHRVVRHTSVGDDSEAIGRALKEACTRADCVLVSGGLGPTSDDITVEAAAQAFGLELELNEDVLEDIRDFFRRTGRVMAPSNEKQAMIPKGAAILANRTGTAPGLRVKLGDAHVIFLPGVPRELYQIFDDAVMPWLAEYSRERYEQRILRCTGLPESDIAQRLEGIDTGEAHLAYQVKYPDILLRVTSYHADTHAAQTMVERVAHEIHERLGTVVYAEGATSLEAVVGAMLSAARLRIATAESCTGGLLASLITDVPGASEYFERGVVTYSNDAKMQMLGVSPETLRAHGAVSRETAMAMAEGVRALSGADIGVALTGIAGPSGATDDKPVGTLHIGLATIEGTVAHHFIFARDRQWFKRMAAATALNLVRSYLLEKGSTAR